jgi:hypothetical protein
VGLVGVEDLAADCFHTLKLLNIHHPGRHVVLEQLRLWLLTAIVINQCESQDCVNHSKGLADHLLKLGDLVIALLVALLSVADEFVVEPGPLSDTRPDLLKLKHRKTESIDIDLVQCNHYNSEELVKLG